MAKKEEVILINISGIDRPGVTAQITEILAENQADVLDIGQTDIHSYLSLGMLIKISDESSGNIFKELLFKANELGVQIHFEPISIEAYSTWVGKQGKNRYIVTVLGKRLNARQLAGVSRIVAEQNMNIDDINRLTGRIPLDEDERVPKASVQFSLRGTPVDSVKLKQDLLNMAAKLDVDISFQEDDMFRRMRRLICFDMDSTLIKTEVIDELAMCAGVGDKVKAITASAMRGEIDFKESFTRRVALLKGLDESVMEEIANRLPVMDGIERLMTVLKKIGFKIAILSGGFTYFGERLKQKYNLDYVYANELEVKDGKLTGNYLGEVVDGPRKAELLKLLAQVEHVDIRQTVAVGDGANDLPMISTAGLGIAFHAKPKVKATADQFISVMGLDGILYFLGYKDSYLDN